MCEALCELLECSPEEINPMTSDGYKLKLDGIDLNLKHTMKNSDEGLLRLGRHIYIVNWKEDSGNIRRLTLDS